MPDVAHPSVPSGTVSQSHPPATALQQPTHPHTHQTHFSEATPDSLSRRSREEARLPRVPPKPPRPPLASGSAEAGVRPWR